MNLIRENGKGLWQHKTDRKSSLSGTVCLSYDAEILKSIILVVFNNVSQRWNLSLPSLTAGA